MAYGSFKKQGELIATGELGKTPTI